MITLNKMELKSEFVRLKNVHYKRKPIQVKGIIYTKSDIALLTTNSNKDKINENQSNKDCKTKRSKMMITEIVTERNRFTRWNVWTVVQKTLYKGKDKQQQSTGK